MSEFIYTSALDKIRRMTKRIKIIQGGSSASKTYSILPILIDKAIKNPMLEISVVAESIPVLKRGAMKDFLKIMKSTNRYIDSNWNRSNFKYTFTNGSYIEFFSIDDGGKLRGARRTDLFVNEANNVNQSAFEQLAMRTSGEIYLDFNPTNYFYAHDLLKTSDEAEFLKLTYKDNQALPDSIIKYLESKRELAKTSEYWKNWCDVYLDGNVGRLEGVVYDNWSTIDKVPETASLIGIGLDFGFTNDPTAATAIYKYNGDIILDEVIYQTGLLNSQIANRLKEYKCEVICDSAEPKSIAELKRYGIRAIGTKKGKGSINFGISILQEHNMLVTKRSGNIIKELEGYTWKKDKNGEVMNVPIDDLNDALDGIRYLAMTKLRVSSGARPF